MVAVSFKAFAKAAVGDTHLAEIAITRIKDASLVPYVKATEGLIALKRRDFAKAESLYREAEQTFEKLSRPDLAALAIAYYAKFALESDAPDSARIRVEAESKFTKARSIDGYLLMSRLSPSTPAPSIDDEPKRRLTQWVFDQESNTLTERPGVTAKGAPAIVVTARKAPFPPRR